MKQDAGIVMKSRLNIGVLTVAFNEKRFIKACINQFEGFGFPHLVLVSERPWHGDWKADATGTIASVETNAIVISGEWPNQAEQFNYGLENYFQGFDWVLIVDADEFYTRDGIKQLIEDLETGAEAVFTPYMKVYWKTPAYRIIPDQTDDPVVAVRPHVRFKNKRSLDITRSATRAILYHLSYVRNDEEMLKKIESFEHTNEFDKYKWYEDVWKKWESWRSDECLNLHPVVPSQFEKAIIDPIPDELMRLLEESKPNPRTKYQGK